MRTSYSCGFAGDRPGPPRRYLVGPAYEVQVVAVQELADHVGAEREGDAAVVLAPALHVLVRQKIFSSTMAAMGRQLKQSVNVFHSLMLNRRLPAARKTRQDKTFTKLTEKNIGHSEVIRRFRFRLFFRPLPGPKCSTGIGGRYI
ncbi:hypothetical protein CRUP_023445 [Coryphaenoides rupestris]|nr:hypothetical protein CRUP_023445 [Coryphaenoides rupestris]